MVTVCLFVFTSLPPQKCRVRDRCKYPVLDRRRELIKQHVPVSEQHILSPLTAVLMPPRACFPNVVAAVFPVPIALEDLVDCAARDLSGPDGRARVPTRKLALAGDMPRSPGIEGMLRDIAVAVFQIAVLGAVIGVSFIGWAAPGLAGGNIL